MSPVITSSMSSWVEACMRSSRPKRSFLPVVVLTTASPLDALPEYTRK